MALVVPRIVTALACIVITVFALVWTWSELFRQYRDARCRPGLRRTCSGTAASSSNTWQGTSVACTGTSCPRGDKAQ
jgi:hypothetical protein